MKWLPKLIGFDYEVQYKKGVDNAATDALSRVQNKGQLMTTMVVTIPTNLFTRIVASWTSDESIQTLLQSLQSGKTARKNYSWSNGQLLRKTKLVVGKDEGLRKDILAYFHSSSVGGHSRVKVTTHRMSSMLYWKDMGKHFLDFIKALPKVLRCSTVIFVVVDRLTKYAYFMPLSHPFSAVEVAQEFLDIVYKLQGLPTSMF
ncbi:retrotransposon-related protein [Tanacetum coccineum]